MPRGDRSARRPALRTEWLERRQLLDSLSLLPSHDATLVESATGNLASGAAPAFYVGKTLSAGLRRSLIEFDLSAIPPGSTINSVDLGLQLTRARSLSPELVSLHAVLASWDEGPSDASGSAGGKGVPAVTGDVTWLHRSFPEDLWTTPGGDFSQQVSASALVGSLGRYHWTGSGLVADVQSWLNDPANNFGWLVQAPEGSAANGRKFSSRQDSVAAQRPLLMIDFTPPAPPQLAISDAQLPEGNSGSTNAVFTVTLSNPVGQAVKVEFATTDVTATSPTDFAASQGTLDFASGVTEQTITVSVAGDTLNEPDETFHVTLSNASGATIDDGEATGTILNDDSPAVTVLARRVFYNNSKFDGNNPAANAADDGAIAPDKAPLLPGSTATFANYTSYTAGINGMMIDVSSLQAAPSEADFTFKVGNNNAVLTWAPLAVAPTISLRAGAGQDGADRVTLIWPDGTIAKHWLRVSYSPPGSTAPDVFYFGNAVGESGNQATNAFVNAGDEISARNNQRTILNPAPITNAYDFNRNGLVNAQDQIVARNNGTTVVTALRLISVPIAAPLLDGEMAWVGLSRIERRESVSEPARDEAPPQVVSAPLRLDYRATAAVFGSYAAQDSENVHLAANGADTSSEADYELTEWAQISLK